MILSNPEQVRAAAEAAIMRMLTKEDDNICASQMALALECVTHIKIDPLAGSMFATDPNFKLPSLR